MLNSFFNSKGEMMYKRLLSLMTVMLFWGCSSKEEKILLHSYEHNNTYHKQLQKTEKIQLYEGRNTKAMLTATYLNPTLKENNQTSDEKFIIGVHLEDEAVEALQTEGYRITLNNKVAKEVRPLENNDTKLKNISFVTEWGSYYEVSFPHTQGRAFSLVFASELYGKGSLNFSKVAKYVISKKAF